MSRNSCKAWVLPLGGGKYAAIGEYEMVHIIPEWVRLQSVPRCPVYCHKVFTWQGQLIPVFDLQAWLRPQGSVTADAAQEAPLIICIVAYEDENRNVGYGGMLLNALPFRTEVSDEQLCDFPVETDRWVPIAVSCFSDPACGPVPILDLPRVFNLSP